GKRWVQSADVLVENFRTGTMERMGLGYGALSALKPDLIYCSLTGYGQTGPRAGAAAYDGAIQASSGMMSQTGHPQTGPTRTGYMPVDMSTALNTAFAISASLYRRNVTGSGQYIDIAMMDTAIVMQAAQYSNYLNQGSLVGLMGNASPTRQPTANVFPTKDGFIQVTAMRQPQVQTLFEKIGHADEFSKPEFHTPEARIDNPGPVFELLSEGLGKNTTAFWMKELGDAGIPVAEVRELPDVVQDEQFNERGVFEQVPSPVDPNTSVHVIKAGYITDADGPEIRHGPPLLGEHTDEILTGLGFDETERRRLRDEGVI
ncbi:MAG: CoA transferase, partial [Pseudomonadales bacterium]|nr:CoA transferase [Pseudomonadales bacterium]